MSPLRSRTSKRRFVILFVAVTLSFWAYRSYSASFIGGFKSRFKPSIEYEDEVADFQDVVETKEPPKPPAKKPICPQTETDGEDEADIEEEPPKYAPHTWDENGLLTVNPDSTVHPIIELIEKAEKEWQTKLKKASQTLDEAVAEYKRRYGRKPPLGFDDWWDYAQENNVLLPDEYDTIHRELEPFWAISPTDLARIQREQESTPDSYTLAKNDTHDAHLAAQAFNDNEHWKEKALLRGMDEIIDLLAPVEDALHLFRVTVSPHDNPNQLADWNLRKTLLDAAKKGEYVDLSKFTAPKHIGFASTCPPNSPGRPADLDSQIDMNKRPPPRGSPKTFIHDHRLSMDPCEHPSIFYHSSQYVAHDLSPEPPLPITRLFPKFSFCTTPLFFDVQTPGFISWIDEVNPRENDLEWEKKTDERLYWRGSNTGMNAWAESRWRHAQRFRLANLGQTIKGNTTVLLPQNTTKANSRPKRLGNGTSIRNSLLNPSIFDVQLTGNPLGCDPAYCDEMKQEYEWVKPVDAHGKVVGLHKYAVDVDGNGWSSRFKRLITSNALVFKATAYPEWWLDRSQAWVHYVPIQVDYSDLYDAYFFFRGGLYGEGNHDDLAKKIAYAGREWSKTFWRKEDMTVYFFRLMLEYARLMSPDREAMSYDG